MDIRNEKVDPDLYADGTWLRFDDETEVKIAAYRNPRHAFALARATLPLVSEKRGPDTDADVAAQWAHAEIESLTGSVLLDWRGMKDGDQELKFSRDAALDVLRTCPRFADWVLASSRQLRHFRTRAEDAAGKA